MLWRFYNKCALTSLEITFPQLHSRGMPDADQNQHQLLVSVLFTWDVTCILTFANVNVDINLCSGIAETKGLSQGS